MAFAQYEAVAVGPLGVGRIMFQYIEVKRSYYIGRRKRTARVAAACRRDHSYDMPAQFTRDTFKFTGTIFYHWGRLLIAPVNRAQVLDSSDLCRRGVL